MFEWKDVDPKDREFWLNFLREEGVPEKELEKEAEKLFAGFQVKTNVKAVLLTEEVMKILGEMLVVCTGHLNNDKLDKVRRLLVYGEN